MNMSLVLDSTTAGVLNITKYYYCPFIHSQKLYGKGYLRVWSLKRNSFAKLMSDADHRSAEEEYCAEAQAVHENLPRLRSPQRRIGCQVQEVPHKEPALEETRNSKVT